MATALRQYVQNNPRVRRLCTIAATALTASTAAVPALAAQSAPDLTTTAGFEATCKAMPRDAKALKNDDARVAWAVCRDVGLVRSLINWGFDTFERRQAQKDSVQTTVDAVMRKVEETRAHLAQTRQVLQRVQLGGRKSLTLMPGQWQLDLDGDGQIKHWETWFFALPKPHTQPTRLSAPSQDEAYYQSAYNAQAQIKVDQSDVLWTLSYHQFIEGVLTAVRAFDLRFATQELVVARPQQLRAAHALIAQGLVTSERLRRSVLAETSDDGEWLANPAQRSAVFPIPMDAAAFATWGEVLRETSAVWRGRHLLPATQGARGVIGAMAPLCAEGKGFDVSQLLLNPPPAGTRVGPQSALRLAQKGCRLVTDARPIAALASRTDRAVAQAGGMGALRYLYWVN